MVYRNKSGRFDALDPAFAVFTSGTLPDGRRRMQTMRKDYLNQFAISKPKTRFWPMLPLLAYAWQTHTVRGSYRSSCMDAREEQMEMRSKHCVWIQPSGSNLAG